MSPDITLLATVVKHISLYLLPYLRWDFFSFSSVERLIMSVDGLVGFLLSPAGVVQVRLYLGFRCANNDDNVQAKHCGLYRTCVYRKEASWDKYIFILSIEGWVRSTKVTRIV